MFDRKAYMFKYHREKYESRKAEGKCTFCGSVLTENDKTLKCEFCRAKQRLYKQEYRAKRRANK